MLQQVTNAERPATGNRRRNSSYFSLGMSGFMEGLFAGDGMPAFEGMEMADPFLLVDEAIIPEPANETVQMDWSAVPNPFPVASNTPALKQSTNPLQMPSSPVAVSPNIHPMPPALSPAPKKAVDNRKRKVTKKYGKVISTIKSNRAKPAETLHCTKAPRKANRIKGVVYQMGDERKKWDGRQWRRLCVVDGCCSASRGATDFCIVHSRGKLVKKVVNNQEIEVLSLAEGHEDKVMVGETKKTKSAVRKKKNIPTGASLASANLPSSPKLMRKRSSEDATDEQRLKKIIKTMERSTITGKQCQFVTALGDACGNAVEHSDVSNPYCYSCLTYSHSQR